jgi:hypothetical protein
MARHIGIVACSAEGAALPYRAICAEGARLPRLDAPARASERCDTPSARLQAFQAEATSTTLPETPGFASAAPKSISRRRAPPSRAWWSFVTARVAMPT